MRMLKWIKYGTVAQRKLYSLALVSAWSLLENNYELYGNATSIPLSSLRAWSCILCTGKISHLAWWHLCSVVSCHRWKIHFQDRVLLSSIPLFSMNFIARKCNKMIKQYFSFFLLSTFFYFHHQYPIFLIPFSSPSVSILFILASLYTQYQSCFFLHSYCYFPPFPSMLQALFWSHYLISLFFIIIIVIISEIIIISKIVVLVFHHP